MPDNIFLSVVIPAYNEEPNFKKGLIDEVPKYLNQRSFTSEVLIVDDGSDDNTAALTSKFIIKNKNFRLIRNPHQGKAESRKTFVIFSRVRHSNRLKAAARRKTRERTILSPFNGACF